MKAIKLFLILIPFVSFFSCDKWENENLEVDKYVKLLKSNEYTSSGLPKFTVEDIGELLKYRNEKDFITNFPRNPISSMAQTKCELRIFILWTIEAIRTGSINSDSWIGCFPSQNPVLRLRDSDNLVIADNEEAHQTATDAYYTWWRLMGITGADYNTWLNTDPLKETKYAWH